MQEHTLETDRLEGSTSLTKLLGWHSKMTETEVHNPLCDSASENRRLGSENLLHKGWDVIMIV